MPSFPPPGSVTICEINRDLITADCLSDDRANDTYGKVLGMVFSPVPFQSDFLVSPTPEPKNEPRNDEANGEIIQRKGVIASLQGFIEGSINRFLRPNDVKYLPTEYLQGVSWHQHKHIIAFISGTNQVVVHDYENAEGKDPCILTHDLQRDVKVLEWRPNGGRTLGGICIWAASFPGNAASVRPGAVSFLGSFSRGSGVRYTLVDFLRSHDEQISALSWSPNGRYPNQLTNFSPLHRLGTPIRRGLGCVSTIKWSPTGDYFFAAKFDGTFYLWETNAWTSEQWSSTSGFVTGAIWDPEGRMILLAFSDSSVLGSIHFASKPPSLVAHLLPVDLPEITTLTNSQGIEKIAWDASGERLAVSFKDGDELYNGLIAVYDVKRTPLICPSLIGFIRGPGDNPKPVAFSFHGKFKQGPLLSVCWSSGFCCTYPLIFRSHVVP
ncbi:aladin [Cucumis melo var. makuwa]|uniref:Aladin n=1 Tax=Cucumis melo var. makuwa TaxID=1194695 RepID=A0A5A7UJP0_CUCMM|nr:aladin [Cucumis melo var. makuwa]TYK25490.1 aladin [Cucumis melo var. makuwa]